MQDIRLIFRGAHYKKISTGEVIYDELQEVLQYVRVERTEGIILQLYPKKATNGYCKKAEKLLLVECDGSLYNSTPMAHHANPIIPAVPWKQIVLDVI